MEHRTPGEIPEEVKTDLEAIRTAQDQINITYAKEYE